MSGYAGSDPGRTRRKPLFRFRSFRVFYPKKTGGFFDFGAVASRKLRKFMVIFARKMPPENSGKFPGNFPGFFFSGKMSPKSPQKNRGK